MIETLGARLITPSEQFQYKFSVCTLVTDMVEYKEMVNSFKEAGFTLSDTEYLYADNCGKNSFDAFSGLNRFLREAKGEKIILCHQDILLHDAKRVDLELRISEIERIDSKWGVIGNAGGINLKHTSMHLTQKTGKRLIEKYLPIRAQNVDENFMVVRNSSNLALSSCLHGFHMYGPDLTIIADVLGFKNYIIDFNLTHKSDGNANKSFYDLKEEFRKNYNRAFRNRFIGTTITRFYISGNSFGHWFFNTPAALFFARQGYKIFRPKSKYHIKFNTKL